MRIALGIICVLFGGFGWVGQAISGFNYPLAQRLGLQEKNEWTDPLFRRAETNTARWDILVLWALPVAGILMLFNHPWWPCLSLVAGGIYLDTAGRETAKYLSLHRSGIGSGSPRDLKVAAFSFTLMAVIALWAIIYAVRFVVV